MMLAGQSLLRVSGRSVNCSHIAADYCFTASSSEGSVKGGHTATSDGVSSDVKQKECWPFTIQCTVNFICCTLFIGLSQQCGEHCQTILEQKKVYLHSQYRARVGSLSHPSSSSLRRLGEASSTASVAQGPTGLQAPPRLEPKFQVTSQVGAITYHGASVPPPLNPASPPETSAAGEQSVPLGAAWFATPPSWDMRQERKQWCAYGQRVSLSGMQKCCPLSDVEVHWVDDPECGSDIFLLAPITGDRCS